MSGNFNIIMNIAKRLVVPAQPTIGIASIAPAHSAYVTFTPPVDYGGTSITQYTATSSPAGIVNIGTTSPIIVSGLANNTSYTFTVFATNIIGDGAPSAASNSVLIIYNQLAPLDPATVNCLVPYFIKLSVSGNSLYVSKWTGGALALFNRNNSNGQLTDSGSSYTGGYSSIAISPDDSFLYTCNNQYSRNTSTGILTSLSPATFTNPGSPELIMSPDGKNLYSIDFNNFRIYQFSRNPTTGLVSPLSPTYALANGMGPEFLTITPNGKFLYNTARGDYNIPMYRRDATTGLLTFGASYNYAGGRPHCIAVSPDGSFLYVNDGTNHVIRLYSIGTTGLLTFVSSLSTGLTVLNSEGLLQVSPDGTTLYMVNDNNGEIILYTRNIGTGALTYFQTIAGDRHSNSIDITADSNYVYFNDYLNNKIDQFGKT